MWRTLIALLPALVAMAADPNFDYDRSRPIDLQVVQRDTRDFVEVQDITFANLTGGRTEAYLVLPRGSKGPYAAILYVHWYEPPDPTSNRTEFLEEAIELGKRGVVSLLPATMWSDAKWFESRKREDDLQNSVAQLKELRRAMDALLTQPHIDAKRVAYVGHDFGAMFGALMAGVDRRAHAYALQAGTTSFSNWYLFGPPMPEPARSRFISDLSVLDPVRHIGKAPPAPVLLQFATHDIFVSQAQANEWFAAAGEPKEIIFYDAQHKLNETSNQDRVNWLTKTLRLKP